MSWIVSCKLSRKARFDSEGIIFLKYSLVCERWCTPSGVKVEWCKHSGVKPGREECETM